MSMEVRVRAFRDGSESDSSVNSHSGVYKKACMLFLVLCMSTYITRTPFLNIGLHTDLNKKRHKNSWLKLWWRKVRYESREMARVTVNMLKGHGSRLSYLFIPAFISIFWLFICLTTTRNPNVTLEDKYLKVFAQKSLLEIGILDL